MNDERKRASDDFRRMITWIVIAGVAMVIAALVYLAMTGDLTTHLVIATVVGVFLSVLLGSGLMAAAYFSDKSGHDQSISDSTSRRDDRR